MSVRDHIRRWLREDRDTPLTLTREQAVELGIDRPAPVILGPDSIVELAEGDIVCDIHRNPHTGEVILTIAKFDQGEE